MRKSTSTAPNVPISKSVSASTQQKSIQDELNSIQIEEDEDDDDAGHGKRSSGGASGFMSSLGFGKRNSNTNIEMSSNVSAIDQMPASLEGWLEKKSQTKVGLHNEWQRRYVRIDSASGMMQYYKTSK